MFFQLPLELTFHLLLPTCHCTDDVFGDDPTTIKLEALGASMFGREAALFVPTGTMANLICCLLHCSERGSELIVGAEAHIHVYEQGGIAQFGGVHSRTVPNEADGTMSLAAIEAAVRPNDVHFPVTRLVCLETTQNRCGHIYRVCIVAISRFMPRVSLCIHTS